MGFSLPIESDCFSFAKLKTNKQKPISFLIFLTFKRDEPFQIYQRLSEHQVGYYKRGFNKSHVADVLKLIWTRKGRFLFLTNSQTSWRPIKNQIRKRVFVCGPTGCTEKHKRHWRWSGLLVMEQNCQSLGVMSRLSRHFQDAPPHVWRSFNMTQTTGMPCLPTKEGYTITAAMHSHSNKNNVNGETSKKKKKEIELFRLHFATGIRNYKQILLGCLSNVRYHRDTTEICMHYSICSVCFVFW